MVKNPGDKESGVRCNGGTGGGGNKKLLLGLEWKWRCAADQLKLLLVALLLLCSFTTLFRFSFPPSDLRIWLSSSSVAALPPPAPPFISAELLSTGVIKRSFNPVGAAAYTFILMSAYRGGAASFTVVGLASKPFHVFGRPSYHCEYQNGSSSTVSGAQILPDWGYGRVYTVVVVTCNFPSAVGVSGGRLLLHVTTNGAGDRNLNSTDTIEALIEPPNTVNLLYYSAPPKYEFLYCGSSLYGNLSPQRVREWIAYHVRLFGAESHFVIHDAGGIHPEVMEVLRPWMELGFVTLHDIRDQERFDGYYHNQFLIVNDCLHRYRFDAKWMLFFDVDEFIYVPRRNFFMEFHLVRNLWLAILFQLADSIWSAISSWSFTFGAQSPFEPEAYKGSKDKKSRETVTALPWLNVKLTDLEDTLWWILMSFVTPLRRLDLLLEIPSQL